MIELWKKNKQVALYVFFGVLTTLVNYVAYFVFERIFAVHYLISNAIAWFIAVVFAYFTNKYYVFEQRKKIHILKEFLEFASGRIFTGVLEMLLLFIMVDFCRLNDFFAKIIIGVIVILLNYIISKLWVFKK